MACAPVLMLPHDAVVLFVHADGVWDLDGTPLVAHDMRVEVMHQPDAVATQLERVGVLQFTRQQVSRARPDGSTRGREPPVG